MGNKKKIITTVPSTNPIFVGMGTIAATAGMVREWTIRGERM